VGIIPKALKWSDIIPLASWFLTTPKQKINPFNTSTSFSACRMFNRVKPPTLIGNLGHILLLMVDKDLAIPPLTVWYAISLPSRLSWKYLGNICSGEEHPKTLIKVKCFSIYESPKSFKVSIAQEDNLCRGQSKIM